MEKNTDFSRQTEIGFDEFFKRFFYVSFQMASELWKMNFNTRWRYLEHSPNIKEYVGKKIRVVRLVEMKISKET